MERHVIFTVNVKGSKGKYCAKSCKYLLIKEDKGYCSVKNIKSVRCTLCNSDLDTTNKGISFRCDLCINSEYPQ